MNTQTYKPGAAFGADIQKEGETWTLVLTRKFKQSPTKVWAAITDPTQLKEWAPFDADRNLAAPGTAMLTTVGAPQLHVTETRVKRAEPPRVLEFTWGGNDIRFELGPSGDGTRLTLWHNIDRNYIAMGAAGWHICFDVLERSLDGQPIGRTVGPDAMKVEGWKELLGEYSKQFKSA